jgi:hypothetical protein
MSPSGIETGFAGTGVAVGAETVGESGVIVGIAVSNATGGKGVDGGTGVELATGVVVGLAAINGVALAVVAGVCVTAGVCDEHAIASTAIVNKNRIASVDFN